MALLQNKQEVSNSTSTKPSPKVNPQTRLPPSSQNLIKQTCMVGSHNCYCAAPCTQSQVQRQLQHIAARCCRNNKLLRNDTALLSGAQGMVACAATCCNIIPRKVNVASVTCSVCCPRAGCTRRSSHDPSVSTHNSLARKPWSTHCSTLTACAPSVCGPVSEGTQASLTGTNNSPPTATGQCQSQVQQAA